ncbi:hypothetical protein [Streptomyces sp. HPF1205]|uniref:hypothetical protein n=1 Tax=Streptomyces sp. HPF1205 TaxID=2873262 RepID=UPI001CECE7E1|nr:hypothetical protein [Streptomyces sp. HPF1205]
MKQLTGTTGLRYAVSDDLLGSGGEAKLYRCTDARGNARVYKKYEKPGGRETAARLGKLQRIGLDIVQSAERSRTFADSPSSSINWPIDLVQDTRGRVDGVILPLIPAQFMQPSRPARTLDFLTLARSVPPPPDAKVRVGVLIRLCNIIGYLQSQHLVHGDVSAKNIVWSADPPQVYLIDCDGLQPFHPAPTKGVVTIGWEDPRTVRKEIPAHDQYSDRYALALALYRGLFLNPGRLAYRNDGSWPKPAAFPPGLDPGLRRLFGRALDDPRATDTRPTANEWVAALTSAFISGSGYRQRALAVLDAHAQEHRDAYARSARQTVTLTGGPAAAIAPNPVPSPGAAAPTRGRVRTPQTLVVPQGTRPAPTTAPRAPQKFHPLPQPPPKRKRNVAAWVLVPLVLLAAGGTGTVWFEHHQRQTSTRQEAPPSAPPSVTACPTTVTSHLPADRRQGAILLHHYLTRLHDITLCTTSDGAIYYHGEVRDKPQLGSITVLAERTATGYVARNQGYTYTIHGSQVTVGLPDRKSASYALVPAG